MTESGRVSQRKAYRAVEDNPNLKIQKAFEEVTNRNKISTTSRIWVIVCSLLIFYMIQQNLTSSALGSDREDVLSIVNEEPTAVSTQKLIRHSRILKFARHIRKKGDSESRLAHCIKQTKKTLSKSYSRDKKFNSIIFRNDQLVQFQASTSPVRDGALYCVPFVVKDNIDVAFLPSASGSSALSSAAPPLRSAPVLSGLLRSGALVVGKANMDEFAMDYYTSSTAGGQTANALDTRRVPGGSSGGSAVSVAARVAPFALGTDTGGSVRIPASFAGLVGLRPTVGLLDLEGVFPLSPTRDTVGPIASSALDVAIVLDALAGPPKAEPAWKGSSDSGPVPETSGWAPGEYSKCVLQGVAKLGGEDKPRVGLLRGLFQGGKKSSKDARVVGDFVWKELENLEAKGVLELVKEPNTEEGTQLTREWLSKDISTSNWELCHSGNAYLAKRRAQHRVEDVPKEIAEIMSPGLDSEQVPSTMGEVLQVLKQDLNGKEPERIAKKLSKKLKWCDRNFESDPLYNSVAIERRKEMLASLENTMQKHNLHAIAYPTYLEFPVEIGKRQPYCSNNRISPITGMPAVTVPIGELNGLPIGMEFLAPRYGECDLLMLAGLMELNRSSKRRWDG